MTMASTSKLIKKLARVCAGVAVFYFCCGEAKDTSYESAKYEEIDDLAMVRIAGGTFVMGCASENPGDCSVGDTPSHSVTLDDFGIMKYEVTQRLWERVMGSNPSHFKGEKLPVENISWNEVQMFIYRLNRATGSNYRLPTEAEWEYAARVGGKGEDYKYAGSNTIGEVAWFGNNSGDRTHNVGTKAPNDFGIHDMSGNVWEWVNDWYDVYDDSAKVNPAGPQEGIYRVIRGGGWRSNAANCSVTNRGFINPDHRFNYLGFRLAHS